MKITKEYLKKLIVETLSEMHDEDPRDQYAMELESKLLSMVDGDREMAAEVLERLKDLIVGQPQPDPEFDEDEAGYEAELAASQAEYERERGED